MFNLLSFIPNIINGLFNRSGSTPVERIATSLIPRLFQNKDKKAELELQAMIEARKADAATFFKPSGPWWVRAPMALWNIFGAFPRRIMDYWATAICVLPTAIPVGLAFTGQIGWDKVLPLIGQGYVALPAELYAIMGVWVGFLWVHREIKKHRDTKAAAIAIDAYQNSIKQAMAEKKSESEADNIESAREKLRAKLKK